MSSFLKVISSTFPFLKLPFSKKKSLFLLLLFLLLLAGFYRITRKSVSPNPSSPLVVRTFALGRVQPTAYIRSITYPMIYQTSRILKLHVDENDVVRKGSPLFTV